MMKMHKWNKLVLDCESTLTVPTYIMPFETSYYRNTKSYI